MSKSIEMNYKQGDNDYEVLYPQVTTNEVIDIHEYVVNTTDGQIEGIIPNPYGVIKIKAVDSEGNPASVQLSVSPQINNSDTIVTDGTSGYFIAYVNPGTYVLTAPQSSAFVSYEIDNPNCVVNTNKVSEVNVSISIVQSGEMEITSSQQIVFPKGFNIPVDIWGCGGGAGGSAIYFMTKDWYNNAYCGGSSGAISNLYQGINVNNKSINITIGTGTIGAYATRQNTSGQFSKGGDGGNTVVKVDENTSYQFSGGICGYTSADNWDQTGSLGANGGNGGGAVFVSPSGAYSGNAGENGGNGGNAQNYQGGIGQGHNTNVWQDISKLNCCGALGGVGWNVMGGGATQGQNGEGAGSSVRLQGQNNAIAGNATTYGSAGGHAILASTFTGYYAQGGSGKQGVVYIRWPSQA